MLRSIGIATFVSAAFSAFTASAAEHTVLIMGYGYFPATIYVQPGDTIRFVNKNYLVNSATAQDSSWQSGPLSENQEFVLAVTASTKLTFASTYDNRVVAQISFGTPPLNMPAALSQN
jgi:plastocyanin